MSKELHDQDLIGAFKWLAEVLPKPSVIGILEGCTICDGFAYTIVSEQARVIAVPNDLRNGFYNFDNRGGIVMSCNRSHHLTGERQVWNVEKAMGGLAEVETTIHLEDLPEDTVDGKDLIMVRDATWFIEDHVYSANLKYDFMMLKRFTADAGMVLQNSRGWVSFISAVRFREVSKGE